MTTRQGRAPEAERTGGLDVGFGPRRESPNLTGVVPGWNPPCTGFLAFSGVDGTCPWTVTAALLVFPPATLSFASVSDPAFGISSLLTEFVVVWIAGTLTLLLETERFGGMALCFDG